MDNLITRKARIGALQRMQQTAHMEEDIDDFDLAYEAELLALAMFGPQAEREHIEAVYDSLAVMRPYGLSWLQALTVH